MLALVLGQMHRPRSRTGRPSGELPPGSGCLQVDGRIDSRADSRPTGPARKATSNADLPARLPGGSDATRRSAVSVRTKMPTARLALPLLPMGESVAARPASVWPRGASPPQLDGRLGARLVRCLCGVRRAGLPFERPSAPHAGRRAERPAVRHLGQSAAGPAIRGPRCGAAGRPAPCPH